MQDIWTNVRNTTTVFNNMGSFKEADLLPEAMKVLCAGLPILQIAVDAHQDIRRDLTVFAAEPGSKSI